MNKILKILLLLSLLFSSANAGWKWDVAKAGAVVGAVKVYKVVKKNKELHKDSKKKKIFTKTKSGERTVYQQKVEPSKIVERKNIRTGETVVETNKERMLKGKPPYINKNGKDVPVELHHSRQNDKGSLFELSKTTHKIKDKDKGANALHPNGNSKNPDNPIPEVRSDFNKERESHWMTRIKNILKEEK